jgi:hypothetical protein
VTLSAAAIERMCAHSCMARQRAGAAVGDPPRRAFGTQGRPVAAEGLALDESAPPTNLAEQTIQVERRRIEGGAASGERREERGGARPRPLAHDAHQQ